MKQQEEALISKLFHRESDMTRYTARVVEREAMRDRPYDQRGKQL
jgi:hypothetical protein